MITSWLGSGRRCQPGEPELRRVLEDQPQLGLRDRQPLAGANEEGNARPAPVLDLEPQRRVRLGGRVRGDPVDAEVAVVLPAHVAGGIGLWDRAEHRDHRVLERLGVTAGGRLHRRRRDNLHEVVDHHVAQPADGIVEVPAILDAEVLRHRDLHALDVVAVPHRLQHPVGEPQEQDLLKPHLPQVMVDPEKLGLLHILVQLLGQLPGRGVIVAERLLHHDPRGVRQPGVGEALDDRREQKRRDLEIEHRSLRALDRLTHARVGRRVGEIPLHI